MNIDWQGQSKQTTKSSVAELVPIPATEFGPRQGCRRPGASNPDDRTRNSRLSSSLKHINGEVVDYAVGEDSRAAGRLVKDLTLPEGAVIALVTRGNQFIPPQGNTRICAGDHVILVLGPGIQPLVNQVFGRNPDVRGLIPNKVEFPLRGSVTVGELQEFYTIQIDAAPERTISQIMSDELESSKPKLGQTVRLGPLLFRVLRLAFDGRIEMVGMSIFFADDPIQTTVQESSNGTGSPEPVPTE